MDITTNNPNITKPNKGKVERDERVGVGEADGRQTVRSTKQHENSSGRGTAPDDGHADKIT